MTTSKVVVRGLVQGVGYRWFTRDAASARGVVGWVRNRRDGSVEALLSGPDGAVDAVIQAMREGPEHAQVEELTKTESVESVEPDAGFEIRPSF